MVYNMYMFITFPLQETKELESSKVLYILEPRKIKLIIYVVRKESHL